MVDDQCQKILLRKLANASNRRTTEIYELDDGALELLPIILQAHLDALDQP